jgi:chromosome segregation protein
MILKKLELFGFKSFAERTVLEFEPGITAIVGPNGCGKSNIVDAIKWVIGEQSPRELRGALMEDVIFNGTQYKEQINFAEVSLTLSNESGTLPIDFSEVTITRRLFREGESEYLINKVPVRLRDIQQLIAGTGIGARSYSLMEQGKIDFIINSKPEERRFIFEEASGITKFKMKKREAMRKLEHTENNLLRLNDVLKEVKRQIGSIERQAKKAEKYKRLFEELKENETKLASLKYYKINDNIKLLEEEKNHISKILSQAQEEVKKIEEEHVNFEEEINKLEAEVKQINQTITDLNLDKERNENKIVFCQERIKEFNSNIEKQQIELTEIDSRIKEIEPKSIEFDKQKQSLENERETILHDLNDKKKTLIELDELRKELEKKIKTSKDEIFGKNIEVSQKNNLLLELEQEKRGNDLRLSRINLEIKKLNELLDNLEKEINSLTNSLSEKSKEKETMQEELNQFKTKQETLMHKVSKLNLAIEEMEKEIIKASSKLESWQEIKFEHQGFPEAVKVLLENKKKQIPPFDKIIGVVAEVIHPLKEKEKILELGLGEKAKAILVKDFDTAHALISFVKENNLGDVLILVEENLFSLEEKEKLANVIPLSEFVTSCDEAKFILRLLNNVYYTEDLEMAKKYSKEYKDLVVVTKEGIRLDKISLKLAGTSEFGIFNREKKIKDISQNIAELKKEKEKLLEEKSNLDDEMRKVKEKVDNLELKINELDFDIKEYERLLNEKKKELQEMKDEKQVIALDREEILRKTQEISQKKENLEETIEAMNEAIKNFEEEIRLSQDRIFDSQKNREQLLIEIAHKESQLNNFQEKEKQYYERYQLIKGELMREKELYLKKEEEIKEYKERVKDLENEIQLKTKEIIRIEDKIQEERNLYDGKINLLNEFKNKQAEKTSKLKPLKTKEIEIKERLHQLELELQEKRYEEDKILTKMRQLYQMESLPKLEEKLNLHQLEERINQLKSSIESLGNVNLQAFEEHEELKTRLNFLETQEKDLTEAKESLVSAIRKINKTTRELFDKSFHDIRIAFKELYANLFGGGEADLVLEGGKDILEAGIEIVVQPPGKKLQNISLLSGGEKALTALALLFALFKVKPSPFCIMDEVDAPLDESNISRFRKLMNNFSPLSQFLIITHNKLTISTADVIYGITMESTGVSKIVSARFRETEEKATV